jgi:hypothetical protein
VPGRWTRQEIENWAADFCGGDRARRISPGTHDYAPEVLTVLLCSACDSRGRPPAELEEQDLRTALLGPVAALELPVSVRQEVPELAAAFLEDLEAQGRVGGGRGLGLFLRALREPFLDAATGRQRPERRPAAKLGSNEPCPCGSGRKYKRCCQG